MERADLGTHARDIRHTYHPATVPAYARPHGRRSGPFRSIAAALVLFLGAMLTAISTGVAGTATAAHAQDVGLRGPSAAVDRFNNQYVFWRGTGPGYHLWEGYYNAYTGKWNGPIDLGMGTLNSEPTVAVSVNQAFAGPGDDLFSGQYVFWRGTGSDDLWMAYWNGKWNGPIDLGMGPLGSGPTASDSGVAGGQQIDIYWEGEDANVWNAYSTNQDPTGSGDYSGPHPASYNGQGLGPLGSSPATGVGQPQCTEGSCDVWDYVVWQGQDGGLWGAKYSLLNHAWETGATKVSTAGTIGGPPSVALEPYINDFKLVWQGSSDDYLWTLDTNSPDLLTYYPQFGDLGSAPTIAEGSPTDSRLDIDVHIFWKGDDTAADLWQAYYNAANNTWSLQNLGMGPLG
jgi:hypothetical protein